MSGAAGTKREGDILFDIKENLKKLPDKPGVYLHKDKLGHVIYVGKAVSLKNRVRQYFQSQTNMAPKVRAMVANIEEFEYITTDSEMEALILECNLIKKYMPKYNVLLRDDKTYPYIKVTVKEDFPRILKTRRVVEDGSRYFGPYSDVGAVNEIIDLLNNVYTLKRCSARSFPDDFRPCLNYHIEQCRGVCAGLVAKEEYAEQIQKVLSFLKGQNKELLEELTDRMMKESEALNFEKAAEYRDKINAIKAINEKQKVVLSSANDMDLILSAKGNEGVYIIMFYVRGGKLSGRESYTMESELGEDRKEIVSSFIKQYYRGDMLIPREIAVEEEPEDTALLTEWLTEMRGAQVRLFVPQKGDKRALMDMARRDVIEMMKVLDQRAASSKERNSAVAAELEKIFGTLVSVEEARRAVRDNAGRSPSYAEGTGRAVRDGTPRSSSSEEEAEKAARNDINESHPFAGGGDLPRTWRIESYDISNTSGVDSVGAMVVFENGRPDRKSYRKFKIRTVDGPDDYSSVQEVIYRRFKRAQEGAPGFERRPDLLFIDGGKGHVNAVKEVLSAMGEHIVIAGMVKDDRHRTRGLIIDGEELDLKKNPVLYRYVTSIQDEVHRFAIDYHHGLRNKTMQRSVLDDIPGIGQQRKKALLAAFGSVDSIRKASVDELAEVDGMNRKSAEEVRSFFERRERLLGPKNG